MATFEQFADRYGSDYDTDTELCAAYAEHERQLAVFNAIFGGGTDE